MYHDSPKCMFDLWSPEPDRWGDNAIENRAFSPFCKHMEECENIIQKIAEGETNIELDDNFDSNDLKYIEENLWNRYGIQADLSIS